MISFVLKTVILQGFIHRISITQVLTGDGQDDSDATDGGSLKHVGDTGGEYYEKS